VLVMRLHPISFWIIRNLVIAQEKKDCFIA
jgi:hypothetical protein